MNDNDAVPSQAGKLPDRDDSGEWRIELRRYPLFHRGHAVLALVGPKGQWIELNGLSKSRNTDEVVAVGVDGGKLIASTEDRTFGPRATEKVGEVARGSYDEIVKGRWARGLRAADAITDKNYDYKGHDPAYEFGGGGQIQNSNSVAFQARKGHGSRPRWRAPQERDGTEGFPDGAAICWHRATSLTSRRRSSRFAIRHDCNLRLLS